MEHGVVTQTNAILLFMLFHSVSPPKKLGDPENTKVQSFHHFLITNNKYFIKT